MPLIKKTFFTLYACALLFLMPRITFAEQTAEIAVAAPAKQSLMILSDRENFASDIESIFKEPFVLQKLTFTTDIWFKEPEFRYLVGLKEGQTITAQDLIKAVSYLRKKNKFDSIELILRADNSLHFNLFGAWTLYRLKLHGIWVGKESYRHYYLMEYGDVFDEQKHQQSLEKIVQAFKNEGFFNGTVKSSSVYDPIIKGVTVNLNLNRGAHFTVREITVDFNTDLPQDSPELIVLKDHIEKNFLPSMRRARYSQKHLNQLATRIEQFLARNGYINSTIELNKKIDREEKKIDLVFSISLLQKKEFIFEGNKFFSRDKLLDNFLVFGSSAWVLPVSILREELLNVYYRKGFWKTTIEARDDGHTNYFVINEGPRTVINKLEFRGIEHFTAVALRKSFRPLLKLRHFDEDTLNKSLEALKEFYYQEGFLDMTLVAYDFVADEDHPDSYALVVTVEEGDPAYIESLVIDPFAEFATQGPFAEFTVGNKKRFKPAMLETQRKWLAMELRKKGLGAASFKSSVKREGPEVHLTWTIDQSAAQTTFGKTIVVGATTFPFEYAQRELSYQEGNAWDKDKLKKSLLNFKELEVFENISLSPDPGSLSPEKTVLLKLQPEEPLEMRLRVGAGIQNVNFGKPFSIGPPTYKFGGSILFKNPFNAGDLAWIDTDFTRSQTRIGFNYQRSWFVHHPVRSLVKAYCNRYEQPGFVGTTKNLYTTNQDGFLLNLQRPFTYADFGINIGFEWMKTSLCTNDPSVCALADSLARAINFTARLLNIYKPFFFLEPTIEIDKRDNELAPTWGTFTLASIKGMFPVGGGQPYSWFIKILAEQSFYFPLSKPFFYEKPIVGAFKFRIGHIFHQSFDTIMPIERFYLGGANSIRSYLTDLAPPLGSFIDCDGCQQFVPQGGKSMVQLNFEVRFPVYKAFGVVLFQDLGTLIGESLTEALKNNLLAGTGFGFRYDTPVGPLRADIGWKWRYNKVAESAFAWFVTFGHAF